MYVLKLRSITKIIRETNETFNEILFVELSLLSYNWSKCIETLAKLLDKKPYFMHIIISKIITKKIYLSIILGLGRISDLAGYLILKLSGFQISGWFLMPDIRLSGRISGNFPDIRPFSTYGRILDIQH